MKYKISIFLLALSFAGTALSAETGDLVFIVNIQNPATEVSMSDIRDYYFKRKRRWPTGESVCFVDRNLKQFLRKYHAKPLLNFGQRSAHFHRLANDVFV